MILNPSTKFTLRKIEGLRVNIPKNIAYKLKAIDVGIVYLFGSCATKKTDFESDLDIGIVFRNPSFLKKLKKRSVVYNQLFPIFLDILPKDFKGELDLVFLQQASYSLQFEAINYGEVIYESSPIFTANYQENVLKNYLDIKPLIEKFYKATLARIK